jgi:predicted rRNA methylase YqxC with S4 and FtsJ domains
LLITAVLRTIHGIDLYRQTSLRPLSHSSRAQDVDCSMSPLCENSVTSIMTELIRYSEFDYHCIFLFVPSLIQNVKRGSIISVVLFA